MTDKERANYFEKKVLEQEKDKGNNEQISGIFALIFAVILIVLISL
jgi:uncharacterized membrane protein